jgi:putative endonuclease
VLLKRERRESSPREIGSYGERVALDFLRQQGYRVLEKNYRCCLGEIDFITEDKNTLVFIEIKFRQNKTYGLPQEAVTYHKQKQIIRVALHYLKKKNIVHSRPLIRFDVVSISPGKIELIKDAFSVQPGYTF